MSLLEIIAILLALSAALGWINHLYFRMPHTIGLVVIALAGSIGVLLFDYLMPSMNIGDTVRSAMKNIDFHKALMEGFLSALLFAGAVHVDLSELRERKWAIGLMATVGVLISTFFIGYLIWWVAGVLAIDLPFMWALVFGALISPTDPVAVLGILKTVNIPPLLKAKITGESLFNDGVGVVVFTIMVGLAMSTAGQDGAHANDAISIAGLFLLEAVGGAILGLVFGLVAFYMMRAVDEHYLEVLITLALVTATYATALHFHMSGPIAVVIAGLLIGNHGAIFAMSEHTREHVFNFWELSDEVLNSILFLLIGLEFVVIAYTGESLWLSLIAIPIVLLGRLVAVSIPILTLSINRRVSTGAVQLLTWGGLRGGISVALALSLPETPYKPTILAATYAVVVFSIIVQGLTMKSVVKHVIHGSDLSDHDLDGTPIPAHSDPDRTSEIKTLLANADSDELDAPAKKKQSAPAQSRKSGQSRGKRKSKRARRRK